MQLFRHRVVRIVVGTDAGVVDADGVVMFVVDVGCVVCVCADVVVSLVMVMLLLL